MSATAALADSMRLDKWLWCARFYKTRALAVDEIGRGRVLVAGASVKPAREIRPGDVVTVRRGAVARQVVVRGLSKRDRRAIDQQRRGDWGERWSASLDD